MTDYKTIFGASATIVGFLGYAPYLRDLLRKSTKPHMFSWLIWGLIETIVFFAQITTGAGPGAWVTGASAIITLFIAGVALSRKEVTVTTLDWVAFSCAIIGIVLWRWTGDPLLAVVAVTIADALGFVPTFRKSYYRPNEETLVEYGLSAVKWMLAIPALASFSLTTWLYPLSLVCTNGIFVMMVLIRRRETV